MTRHVRLKTPCPLCQGRLDAVVRRMPLLGWHMVGLTCGHGCDIRWFNRDIDFQPLMVPDRRRLCGIPRRLPPWLRRICEHAALNRMSEMRGAPENRDGTPHV